MRSVSNPDNLGTDSLIDTATPYAYVPYEYNVLFEWLLLYYSVLRIHIDTLSATAIHVRERATLTC